MAAQGDEGRSWVVPLTGLFAECAREMAVGRAEEEFTKLGVQYYAAARSSAWSGLWVCGNLYHHSIEMFLKAGLARRFSLEELHKKFNHRLNAIWNAFQTDFPSPTLTEFNRLIADLAPRLLSTAPIRCCTRGNRGIELKICVLASKTKHLTSHVYS